MFQSTAELLKEVRKIEIKTKGLSRQIFTGSYHSAFKGRGMAFSEVREYQIGDEIRTIDWNVTARLGKPYIKVFEEERELTVMLLVDVSASDNFGTQRRLKKKLITELCAVLAFSATQNNDKTGVIFFSDHIEKYIPPKKGKSHTLRIIRELLDFEPKGTGTDLKGALKYLTQVVKKRCIAFAISDFMAPDYDRELRLAGKKHDLLAMRIYDPKEMELPKIGLVQFKDPETGELLWVNTNRPSVRKKYAKAMQNFVESTEERCKKAGVQIGHFETSDSYVQPLTKLFKRKG
ncbi:MAG: hypothetical protein ACI9YL_002125 [Luteibaculaceae bacterium]|jgi:uncharacterized protein (DUF58 family)